MVFLSNKKNKTNVKSWKLKKADNIDRLYLNQFLSKILLANAILTEIQNKVIDENRQNRNYNFFFFFDLFCCFDRKFSSLHKVLIYV